jgi:predicted small metal-binding protein
MLRQVRCECGYVARSQREDEVISLILAHVATDHPDLAETETADDVATGSNWCPTDLWQHVAVLSGG